MIYQWKKILFSLLAISVIFFALVRLYYNLTDDFRLANISSEIPFRSEWEVPVPTVAEKKLIDSILAQEYSYIGKGAQSYAFGSADGKYVIKFFKYKHLRPSLWLDLLPALPPFQAYREKQYSRKTRKFEGVFAGYRLAYEVHRKESGLIFIHLNLTEGLYPTITVKDKMGWRHSLPLDRLAFILQERAEAARTVIHDLLLRHQIESAKYKIDQIFDMYALEYRKGIYDNDHGVMRNVGFAGNRPIHLDVGKLKKDDSIKIPDNYAKDLELVKTRMTDWFSLHEPDDFPELKSHIEKKIDTVVKSRS